MKNLRMLAFAAALISGSAAQAAIVSGYSKAAAVADGWTVLYQGDYAATFNYSNVLNSIAAGTKVALASSSSATASTFDLFAGTSLNILQTITAPDTTVFADNAYWYRNGDSVGFAPTAIINQGGADTENSGFLVPVADPLDGALRLSWHEGLTNATGGWRSGLTFGLNSNIDWQRYVLVQLDQDLPEPASLALFGLGAAGLAAARRKSAKKA